jgi:hypothetical protein
VEVSETPTKILCSSNAPKSTIECSNGESIGFGNSPYQRPLQKVIGGQKMFREIVNSTSVTNQEELVGKLFGMLKCREE